MKTVFVAGIHGVGKSYLCEAVANTLNIPHYGASALIKEYNSSLVAKNKAVKDIAVNQDALVERYKELPETPIILMDGHVCLLKDGTKIERIPMRTFESLDICSFVLVTAEIETILERMKERDGILHNRILLEQMMYAEHQYSEEIARLLAVPIVHVTSTQAGINQVNVMVKEMLRDCDSH